jgi:hypothetical protein
MLNGWNDWLFLSSSPATTEDLCKKELKGEIIEKSEISQENTNGKSTETLILQNVITTEEKSTNMIMSTRKRKKLPHQ